MSEFAHIFLVSFIGGLSAAIVSHLFSIISEKLSRNRRIFDDLYVEVEGIISKCVELSYAVWGARGGDKPVEELDLICQIYDISTIISFLQTKGAKTDLRVGPAYANFRRSISGGDFDVKGRAPDPTKMIEIRSYAIAFRVALRDAQYEANRLF
ncbi:MAG: hypothetical protein E5X34_23365 [Mesorhizobium sp.]|uniref:hypothetical protein n=1 Tax=Mesorhizobium sp. TaxID=1871066 RepID=UPI0012271E00|nr:hypothetical protein [Mesorhizobium sp.]TIR17566.1 MAG: hypothetical protein E5X34_23365 [Mesorhizobium sp.]